MVSVALPNIGKYAQDRERSWVINVGDSRRQLNIDLNTCETLAPATHPVIGSETETYPKLILDRFCS
jgi:hypothetical protein